MKIFIFTFFCLCAISITGNAQVLYGTTSYGGKYGGGTINKYDAATHTLNAVKSFTIDGKKPEGSLTRASDGKLYGMTNGGAFGAGTIFSYDAVTGTYTQLANFDGTNGYYPKGRLIQATDGKLYGMTRNGGSSYLGNIFSFDPVTSTITNLHDFNGKDGAYPEGDLIQASDGKLYGMTFQGGPGYHYYGDASIDEYGDGIMFSYDLSTSTYTKLLEFGYSTNSSLPNGSLIQASDGNLYGTATYGGIYSAGVIFSYNLKTSSYTQLHSFDNKEGYPTGTLLQASNGKLYGMTPGNYYSGVIFSYDLTTSTYSKLYNLTHGAPKTNESLIQVDDGKLYGTMDHGYTAYRDAIFSFNPITYAYTEVYNFDQSINGEHPTGSLLKSPGGELYALTNLGGTTGNGVIFSYDISTDTYDKLKDFGGNQEGSVLSGGLCKASDGNLYGTTTLGGRNNVGVIFSYNPVTDAFSKLYTFFIKYFGPYGSLLQATDGKLYGMTFKYIFSFDHATSTYTKLYNFKAQDGYIPYGSLVQASDGKLYGMTNGGGKYYKGVIFSYNLSTSTYTKLYDFDGSNGAYPYGSLVLAKDGKLYGMTKNGGMKGTGDKNGVIFSYNPSTSTYTKLYDFDVKTGANPSGNLIQASDGKLYGMATYGGINSHGVIFSYNPVTSTYTKMQDFDGTNGAEPLGSLMQASDGKLYGMTSAGGSLGYGVTFSYDPAVTAGNFQKLADFRDTNGRAPYFTSFVEVSCSPKTFYKDADGDGYGSINNTSTTQSCTPPAGYVADSTDCNDQDSTIYPNAPELCDGKDNNCDGNIDENCTMPEISIGDVIAFEGDSGEKKMNFKVSLSSTSNSTVKVNYTTLNSTAKAPEDYKTAKGTLTFTPGTKEQTITVLIKGDQQVEYPELFKVQLSNTSNATISNGVGRGIIMDNDLRSSDKLAAAGANTSTSGERSTEVYPNPAHNVVNLRLNGYKGNTTLQLMSYEGELLKELNLQGTFSYQLNVSDLASGTYFLTVKDENGYKQAVKLVIAR